MSFLASILLSISFPSLSPSSLLVEVQAACIRYSGLSDSQQGILLMKFVKNGMNPHQVSAIFGRNATPMQLGFGFDNLDYWYINHGVIVYFHNRKVTQVRYSQPPTDENGVPLKVN